MKAGLPTMLYGKMGVAKTAKINKVAKEEKAKVIPIDLSARDRVTVYGYPDKIPFVESVIDKEFHDSPDFAKFRDKLKANEKVPSQTTSFEPNEDIARKIEEVRKANANKGPGEEDIRLVLFFDEINRCNPILTSAVFEAISNEQFLGVSLKGVDYTVVAAGNADRENPEVYTVKDIDTAALHRFASKYIDSIESGDLETFKNYIKNEYPIVTRLINQLTDEQLLSALNAPLDASGDGDLDSPVFSMRTLQSLDEILSRHRFSLTSHLDVGSKDKIINILESESYLLNLDANASYSIDFKDIEHYYTDNPGSFMVGKDFISRTIDLLSDDTVPEDDLSKILAQLHLIETDSFSLVEKELNGVIPEEFQSMFRPLIMKEYSNFSDQEAGSVVLNNIFDTKDKAVLAEYLSDLLGNVDPSGVGQYLFDLLESSISSYDGTVEVSHVFLIIEVFKSLPFIQFVDIDTDLEEKLIRLSDAFGDKIISDKPMVFETNILNVYDNFRDKPAYKFIETEAHLSTISDDASSYIVRPKVHSVGTSSIPDFYTVNIGVGDTFDLTYNSYSLDVYFDNDFFKVELIKSNQNDFATYKYTMESKFFRYVILANVTLKSAAKYIRYGIDLDIPSEYFDDANNIPDIDVNSVRQVIETTEFFGDNIPKELQVGQEELEKIKQISKKVKVKLGEEDGAIAVSYKQLQLKNLKKLLKPVLQHFVTSK